MLSFFDGSQTATGADDKTSNHASAPTAGSSCLDYRDMLNNISHIRVHWLPMGAMHSKESRDAFYDLVIRFIKASNRRGN